MIVKLLKIINCSSEHPDFPASNLLHSPPPGPWKCAKPGELLATVIFELSEPTCIIGLDIGNFRSCIVVVTASTSAEPDNWVPIVNHQFMTHDEAANNKFKDQVQLFTKNELASNILKIKFDRVKVTCMQSANLKQLFGLSFFILRTEVVLDVGIDVFGRFKLKNNETEKSKSEFKEKYLRLFPEKQKTFKEDLVEKMKETAASKFNKRQEEERTPKKRPLLEKLEAGKVDEVFGKTNNTDNSSDNVNSSVTNSKLKNVIRTPFGDVVQVVDDKKKPKDNVKKPGADKIITKMQLQNTDNDDDDDVAGPSQRKNLNEKKIDNNKPTIKPKRKSIDEVNTNDDDDDKITPGNAKCSQCLKNSQDKICQTCKRLPLPLVVDSPRPKKPKVIAAPKKEFSKLFEGTTFSLSGYVNPQRDEIRQKALKMGAKYINNPDTTNNKCTFLICAFKNTPKIQQLKGHTKIVSHILIEECFDHKKRYPWRRYAMISKEKKLPESEEEIEGVTSPLQPPNPYEQDTDSDADY
ncbi:hypothetical protein PV327_006962 [Microctonus hyperodae]|uniref:BRCT domain-containing protein n=1 Tax=Microctonus hyperodae TaxID=165561 RepID=A0AA39F5I8_MICHY|nr:hypothetical protein PV327_006962 [Microctonus hyperodae]